MPNFTVQVHFQLTADSLEAVSPKLRELAAAAQTVGFQMQTASAKPSVPPLDSDALEWTGYGPEPS
jgi:hypothetical protein